MVELSIVEEGIRDTYRHNVPEASGRMRGLGRIRAETPLIPEKRSGMPHTGVDGRAGHHGTDVKEATY